MSISVSGPVSLPPAVSNGYVNHIDTVSDTEGNIYALIIAEWPELPSKLPDPRNGAYLLSRAAASGQYNIITTFFDSKVGKNGYGALSINGADIVCILSVRLQETPSIIQGPVEYVVKGAILSSGS